MSGPEFVERSDPDEVFTSLADPTRVAILQSLWETDGHEATFSEIRTAVGMSDSGQFNYHLNTLTGQFVAKTDAGYSLTQAGELINGAIATGAYTLDAAIDPITLEPPCPTCGGTKTFYYEDETVRIECDSCPITSGFVVPPGVFAGYDRESIPDVASRYLRSTFQTIKSGFCWYCEGRIRPTVDSVVDVFASLDGLPEGVPEVADSPSESTADLLEQFDIPTDMAAQLHDIPWVKYECDRCGATPTTSLDFVFLDHPAVVSFYHDHGIDVREQSMWELELVSTDRAAIRRRDPFRAHVTYRVGDDSLTIVVDDALDVVEIEAYGG
ncbi:MAG: DUF7351 domain-containing protein [Halobacteriota archaeon]